ncbi:hypothetical protein BCR32DRAFT_246451 [Anaeromyces robustus]|uniref:Coth-domain-containing protein n=1 Tax=Anaeromyces robustus TaxID=1754192 RepID=A0A1Y1X129_9FUNG|nr:hypothetical protein BCR32DRAFT_246451 [Anaeromyces robustus]|eukprot:ORX79365.1 hypothetical protein BCR32DRAFT_246451 [Anaeromyces robustus]
MKIKFFSIFISSLFALGKAYNYNFNVVSILGEGYSLGVKIENTIYSLEPTLFPLFNGTITADYISEYKYVALNQQGAVVEEESISRTYTDTTSQINEVYNRTNKNIEIPELPEPLKPMFKMGGEDFKPIPNNIIYNFYAKCNDKDYTFVSNEPFLRETEENNDLNVNCTFTIISPKDTYQSTGSIHLIGWGSRQYKKLSWAVKLDKKFMGRKSFKLRAVANEPTLIRERLAEELYNAAGVPTQQGTYARVFINNDIYGLYTLIDSFSKNWIAGTVHGNSKAKIGVSYKFYANDDEVYPNFKYLGDDYNAYEESGNYEIDEFDKSTINPDNESEKWAPLIRFTQLYTDWYEKYNNDNSDSAIEALTKFLNVESLLRLMTIETLTAAFDNLWLYNSNSALYYNPERDNYQFISFDYDQSLGGWLYDENINYDTITEDCITWVNPNDPVIDHSFFNSLLSHPQILERYNVILAKVTRIIFDPDTVSKFIYSLAELIREDVSWNFESIDQLKIEYDGHVNHYTFEDFENNLGYTPIHNITDYRFDDTPYGLMDWVKKKGDGCKNYTRNININNDINISDDYEVEVYRDNSKPNINITINSTIAKTNTKTKIKTKTITTKSKSKTKTKIIGIKPKTKNGWPRIKNRPNYHHIKNKPYYYY